MKKIYVSPEINNIPVEDVIRTSLLAGGKGEPIEVNWSQLTV